MTTTITLPFWPESRDCLDWSRDNQIVVVGGESIAILTARLNEPDTKGQGQSWHVKIVPVSAFSRDELPLALPLSNSQFCVGEELSTRQAIGAKWSYPGLARHKGCALAVLTANHVLSIWTTNKKCETNRDWSRKLIVNSSVQAHYAQHVHIPAGEAAEDERKKTERLQVKQRIRAFCWLPPTFDQTRQVGPMPYVVPNQHHLAVTTEGGHILILSMRSPNERLSNASKHWDIRVVAALSVRELVDAANVSAGSSPSPNAAQVDSRSSEGKLFAEHIAFGEWTSMSGTFGEHGISSRLAFVVGGKLFTTHLSATNIAGTLEIAGSGPTEWHMRDRDNMTGPLRFPPAGEHGHLVAFGHDGIYCITLAGAASHGNHISVHHLDDRWDEISGVTFANAGDGTTQAHIVSHLCSSTATTAALELPLKSDSDSSLRPIWQEALQDSRDAYSDEHGLKGEVQERVWGIAASPLGESVATCLTVHPSSGLEYAIQKDQKSILSITFESKLDEGALLPTPRNSRQSDYTSVEALLFALKQKYAEVATDVALDEESEHVIAEDILRNLPAVAPLSERSTHAESEHAGSPMLDLEQHFRRVLLEHPLMRYQRAVRLAGLVTTTATSQNDMPRAIVKQLAAAVAEVPPEGLRDDAMSSRLKKLHKRVISKLEPQGSTSELANHPSADEKCTICQSPIPLESIKWAKCATGHQFARCALSFYTIQEPGMTKACGICGLHYLDQSIMPEFRQGSDDVQMVDVPGPDGNEATSTNDTWVEISRNQHAISQTESTLTISLFTACDVCIYCGGRFTS